MFNPDFYPTPSAVIDQMTAGLDLAGKTVLEPSAGVGVIVDHLQEMGANAIACETDTRLRAIVETKCKIIEPDFLQLTADRVSHISAIVMNPPFSNGAEHLLHAFNIAPPGCKIVCLLNLETVKNPFTRQRQELKVIIQENGVFIDLGACFDKAERRTLVNVALVKLEKPGQSYENEFEGFFMDDDPEEAQENGIMSYNAVREVVNRYVSAVKLYDKQLELAAQMNDLTQNVFFRGLPKLSMTVNRNSVPIQRNEFKKSMQKAGWNWIFEKMDLEKHTTKGLRADINKFVEEQQEIPFTMRNIYKMLGIVVATTGQRMDRAILEAFDLITKHHADNRYNLPGWKTNSHFLVGKKIILPGCVAPAKEYKYESKTYNSLRKEEITDLEKALCFVLGVDFGSLSVWNPADRTQVSVNHSIHHNTYGEWYESYFFKYKAFKNGNMHFEFKDENAWGKFNQKVAELKGYPLFESKPQTAYQKRQTGRKKEPAMNVLFSIDF